MRNNSIKPVSRPLKSSTVAQQRPLRIALSLFTSLLILILVFQSACSSKRQKIINNQTSTIKIVPLPLNLPSDNPKLRWIALAAPVILSKASENSRNLEVIPLWEAMTIAKETTRTSRLITADSAAYIAGWLAAKWSITGELSQSKGGISMMLDFIPSKTTQTPFRYFRTGNVDYVGSGIRESCDQFLFYLVAKPLTTSREREQKMSELRNLAEALDREYGWFVKPEPGKAEKLVANLAYSDSRLARLLFNPSVYSSIENPPDHVTPPEAEKTTPTTRHRIKKEE
jgi:hypothetical protein